jgi:sugar phosphate isomerase/epimerase
MNEDHMCDFMINNTYGSNRYLFEEFIKKTFPDNYIIRLPALFGKGLKKNIIFDLLKNNNVQNIAINTSFQWYDLNWLKCDIEIILKNDIRVCNLFTEPINTLNIIKLFDYPIESFNTSSTVSYNTKTKYGKKWSDLNHSGYIRSAEETLHNIYVFVKQQEKQEQRSLWLNSSTVNNLVVSNICFKHISQFQFACILKLFNISNVQIAPTTLIQDWSNIKQIKFDDYTNNNVNIYSFQSITFGLQNQNIFDDNTRDKLMSHLKTVIDCAIHHNVKVLVFGCPKNRKILNKESESSVNNDNIFSDFFRELGHYIGDNDLKICIENNSKLYDCNYLNTINEVGEIVTKINHKNIRMMVDIGNAVMENDILSSIYKYSNIIYNVDIALPNMTPLTSKKDNNIRYFINILNNIGYRKNVNLEMLIKEDTPELELNKLIVSLTYFIEM